MKNIRSATSEYHAILGIKFILILLLLNDDRIYIIYDTKDIPNKQIINHCYNNKSSMYIYHTLYIVKYIQKQKKKTHIDSLDIYINIYTHIYFVQLHHLCLMFFHICATIKLKRWNNAIKFPILFLNKAIKIIHGKTYADFKVSYLFMFYNVCIMIYPLNHNTSH